MFSVHLSLLFISTQIFHVLCAGGSQATPSDTRVTLPLTLILLGNWHDNPTKLEKAEWSEGNKALIEGTRFSSEQHGRMTFLCAITSPTSKTQLSSRGNLANFKHQHCSYHVKFQPKQILQCVYDAEPVVEKLNLSSPMNPPEAIRCGPGNRGEMYWFTYKICNTEKDIENEKILRSDFSFLKKNPVTDHDKFIIYRFCYDERVDEVIFTYHQIMAPRLLEDENMKNEREKEYEMITDGYNISNFNFKTLKMKYSEIIDPSTGEQLTISSRSAKPSYNIQKLVLPEDFSFALWKKPAYHFLNTKLMREELVPLWNHINDLIRRDAIKHQRRYYLYTGTFNKSQNQEKTNPGDTFQAPDIWLKVIEYAYVDRLTDKATYEALAIMMDNSYDDTRENVLFKNECQENLCQDAFKIQFPNVSQYVRCCRVTKTIISYLDKNLLAHNLLRPDFLFFE